MMRNLVRVEDGLVGLCDRHYAITMEAFGPSAIMLERGKSRVDWHDRIYHEGVPDHILKGRSTPERNRKYY